jgi:hypothetical protein
LASNLLFVGLVGVCALYFTHWRFALNEESPWAPFADLVNGTAATPFQYRALIPWIVSGLRRLPGFHAVPLPDLIKSIEFVSAFALTLAFRRYLSLFFPSQALTAVLSLSVFYALPFHFLFPRELPLIYPSDLPAILFFTWGLICLRQQNWKAYYPLFLVATLNRETTCFLILVYVFTAAGRSPRRSVALHALAQTVLWVGAKAGLYWLYRDNPGFGVFEDQWRRNLPALTEASHLIALSGMWGFTWVPVLIWFRLIRDVFVRRSLFVLIPFLLGMAAVGVVYEMRIYGEPLPLVLSAFWLAVQGLAQREEARRVGPEAEAAVPAHPSQSSQPPPPLPTRFGANAAWLSLGLLWLSSSVIAVYLWAEQKANLPAEHLRGALNASLQNALAAAGADEHIVVVNWPRAVRAGQPLRLLGVLPFTPSPVSTEWPADPTLNITRLEYRPWQGGGAEVGIDFSGAQVTQPELTEHILQAERIIDFHAGLVQMYTLAERWPAQPRPACRAEFAGSVCLVDGALTQYGDELRLDLVWRVERGPAPEITVFVHVFDAGGALAAQADGDPIRNLLPLARWPGPDDVLRETRWATRPAGAYQVRVGLYDRSSGERLEAACASPDVCGPDGLVLNHGPHTP